MPVRNTGRTSFAASTDGWARSRSSTTISGAQLFRSHDGENWLGVTRNGFENPYNYGIRTLSSTPHGLAVGLVNPFGPKVGIVENDTVRYEPNPNGGLEIWLGAAHVIDRFRPNWRTWERLASRRLLAHSIRHDGLRRDALLYVPRHMMDRGQLPLVLVFHGGASSPEAIARISAMHRIAENEGFIVAYPTGTLGGSGLTWNPSSKANVGKTEDARFVRKLIVDLQRTYEIDPARIFAAGFSIGGSLVYDLAGLLADQIAAVAVVSGTMTTASLEPVRPVSLIHIHGTNDRRVPLGGRSRPLHIGQQRLAARAGRNRSLVRDQRLRRRAAGRPAGHGWPDRLSPFRNRRRRAMACRRRLIIPGPAACATTPPRKKALPKRAGSPRARRSGASSPPIPAAVCMRATEWRPAA